MKWRELHRLLVTTREEMVVTGRHPVLGDVAWIASAEGLNRYDGTGANTATWYPDGDEILAGPVPVSTAEEEAQASRGRLRAKIQQLVEDAGGEVYEIGHAHGGNVFRLQRGLPPERVNDGWLAVTERAIDGVMDLIEGKAVAE